MALAGRRCTLGTRRPQGARSGPLMVRRPRGPGRGLQVKGERRAVLGGGGGGAAARGGEVMARRSGAALLVPAAR